MSGKAPAPPSARRIAFRQEAEMAEVAASSSRALPRPLVFLAGVFGMLVAATALLWVHYGTAVFFEMIRAGFAACF
jgi:hypothetical protein